MSNINEQGLAHSYEIIIRNKGVSFGVFDPGSFINKLKGTNLVRFDEKKQLIKLTNRGKIFAKWLIENNKDAETYNSGIGRWGKEQSAQDIMNKYIDQKYKEQ